MEDLNEQSFLGGANSREATGKLRQKYCDTVANQLTDVLEKSPNFLKHDLDFDSVLHDVHESLNSTIDDMYVCESQIPDIGSTGSFPTSKILKPTEFEKIAGWLPMAARNKNWKKVYTYTVDGKSKYISAIKGCADTVVVFKSGNNIFGGYMDKDWGKYNGYFKSEGKPFLYSITKGKKYPYKQGNNGYYETVTYGLSFGGDLYITNSNFSGYCNPNNYSFSSYTELSGAQTWTPTEVEFYHLR
jgi:hypothetical protein